MFNVTSRHFRNELTEYEEVPLVTFPLKSNTRINIKNIGTEAQRNAVCLFLQRARGAGIHQMTNYVSKACIITK